MPSLVKYGLVRGGEQGSTNFKLKSAQYIPAQSAKFMTRGANLNSDILTLAVAGDSNILGHLECEEMNSSDGTEVRKLITDPTAIFRVPIISTTGFTTKLIGRTCDIATNATTKVQGAALDSSTDDVLLIVDGDVNNSKDYVDVMIIRQFTAIAGLPGVV